MHQLDPLEAGLELPDGEREDQSSGAPVGVWTFRVAVLRHQRVVYGVAMALLRQQHDAEDVTQEAFLRFWRQGGGVRQPREWLLRVARNLCLDRLRAAGRFVDQHGEDGELELPDERDPAWHYEQRELAAMLTELIHELPEPQRSLLVMFDLQGVQGDACARILGLSINQVKVYLHRARRRLRSKLEKLR